MTHWLIYNCVNDPFEGNLFWNGFSFTFTDTSNLLLRKIFRLFLIRNFLSAPLVTENISKTTNDLSHEDDHRIIFNFRLFAILTHYTEIALREEENSSLKLKVFPTWEFSVGVTVEREIALPKDCWERNIIGKWKTNENRSENHFPNKEKITEKLEVAKWTLVRIEIFCDI